jgi:hypothetical protein
VAFVKIPDLSSFRRQEWMMPQFGLEGLNLKWEIYINALAKYGKINSVTD